jgi:hypothetical protein
MIDQNPEVTLNTLPEDLRAGFADLKVGLADVKATLITGFRSLATRESNEGMVHLPRERIRILAYRPPELDALDARIREQALELQQVLRALAEETQRFKDRGTQGEPGVADA